jgi:hypothetical protein
MLKRTALALLLALGILYSASQVITQHSSPVRSDDPDTRQMMVDLEDFCPMFQSSLCSF